jgi:hypothetical protein
MERIKILALIVLMIVTSIIIRTIILCLIPIYCLGAIFWKRKDFDRLIDGLYQNIKEANF